MLTVVNNVELRRERVLYPDMSVYLTDGGGITTKNKRKAAKKASTSLLMLLIIASAILAFVPFRVTLATGNVSSSLIGSCSSPSSTCSTLLTLAGTHIAIDSLGLFTQTSTLNALLVGFVGSAFTPAYQSALSSVDYFAMKAQKITVDIMQVTNGTAQGLLGPFGSGPVFTQAGAGTIELRIVLLSVTISGYKLAGQATNKYGEVSLTGLNAALMISLDRAFIDLFIDPLSGVSTYLVQADMTVYQGLALLLEAATL